VSRGGRGARLELKVNPIACEAHGMCIELLPELIGADPWGYPVTRPGLVPADLLALARRAVNACPTMALLLASSEPDPGPGHDTTPGGTARRA
jgi:ferredoxin